MSMQDSSSFEVCLLTPSAQYPKIATKGSAGYDLFAPFSGTIEAGERVKIPLGIRMKIPEGHFGQICGRSGLALKHGLTTLGGIIDSDYRGELAVILFNSGREKFSFEEGDRIAQMVISKMFNEKVVPNEKLGETGRSEGFGSTGR